MALARIITRSDICSRELALTLLDRGYAVEIVTPDDVPDNFADLELRVEATSCDRLTASVIARNGEYSATLDFVGHVKVPTANAVLTSPLKESHPLQEPVVGNVQNTKTEDLPVEALALSAALPAIANPSTRVPDLELETVKSKTNQESDNFNHIPPIVTERDSVPRLYEELGDCYASESILSSSESSPEITIDAALPATPLDLADEGLTADIEPLFQCQNLDRAPGALHTVVVSLTAMALLLALIVGIGISRAHNSASSKAENVSPVPVEAAVATGTVAPENERPVIAQTKVEQRSRQNAPSPAPASKSATNSVSAATRRSSPTAKAPTLKARADATSTAGKTKLRNGDLIARDTVVYLDRPATKLDASKKAPSNSATHEHRSGEITNNSATSLNGPSTNAVPPTPKSAK
jgi:hypothetical protein